MHCASCARLISQKLKETDGVTEANVNFAAAKAYVFLILRILKKEIIEVVKSAGYGATIADERSRRGEEKTRTGNSKISEQIYGV